MESVIPTVQGENNRNMEGSTSLVRASLLPPSSQGVTTQLGVMLARSHTGSPAFAQMASQMKTRRKQKSHMNRNSGDPFITNLFSKKVLKLRRLGVNKGRFRVNL